MNVRRLILVAWKTLVETVRSPVLLILLLGLPVFFALITYVGYGRSPRTATYPVLVLNSAGQDAGLIQVLSSARYTDERPFFELKPVESRESAEVQLKSKQAAALLVIEKDGSGKITYVTRGDPMNMQFIKASAQLEALVIPWLERQQGKDERFRAVQQPLTHPRPVSDFDAYIPGMLVFAILLIIPQTAMLIGQERRSGSLKRLTLSLLRPSELLGGLCLAQMAIAAVQVTLLLLAAVAMGFHVMGSFLLALVIGWLIAFGSIGIGLLMGCFMRNDIDALNTGSTVSMLQVFFSGAFFAMPAPTLAHLFGHPFNLFDFLPATNGMIALQQVLSGGAGLGEVGFRVAATALFSLLFYLIGVLIYRWVN